MFLNRGGSLRSKTPGGKRKRRKSRTNSTTSPGGLLGLQHIDLDAVSLLSNPISCTTTHSAATNAPQNGGGAKNGSNSSSRSSSSKSSASSLPLNEDDDQLMEMEMVMPACRRSPKLGKLKGRGNFLSLDGAALQQVLGFDITK